MQNLVLKTEELSRALIANLPDGAVFVVDRHLRYLLAQGEALSTAGFTPEDFVGRTIFEVLPPELIPKYEQDYRRALAGEPFETEHHSHDHGASVQENRWYITRGTPLHSPTGEVYAVLVVSYDITERKRVEDNRQRAEAALRESKERQTFLLTLSDALRSLINPVEIQETVTRTAMNYFRADRCYYCEIEDDNAIIRRDAVRGDLPTVAGVYPLTSFAILQAVIKGGRPFIVQDVYTTDTVDDDLRQLCIQLQVISYINVPVIKNGKPVGVLCLVQSTPRAWTDLEVELAIETAERTWAAVERARAETALRGSEAKYRSLFNSIDDGFCIIERVAGEPIDFRYIEVNPAFAVQTGIRDVVGKTIRELVSSVPEAVYEIYENVLNTGEPIRSEIDVPSINRTLELYAFQTEDESRLAVIFKDISDRKRREMILRENEVRQAFLLKLSDILQQFVQPNDIKAAAMRLLGEHLGVSRAQYHECDRSGEYYSADGVGYANGLPLLDLKYQIDAFGTFVNEDFAAGRPYRIDDLEVSPRVSTEEREAYRSYQIRAGAGVPLIRGGKLVAILAVHDVHPHPWTDLEIELIRETAERIWTPLERARAEVALSRAAEMDGFRVKLSDALRSLSDAVEIQATVTRTTMNFFRADRCYYCEIIDGSAIIRRDASQADLPTVVGAYPLENSPIFRAMLEGGQPFVFEDVHTTNVLDENLRQTCKQLQIIAAINVPVIKQGEPVGILAITQTTPRNWTEFEMGLAEEIADRTWATIERTRAEANLREAELQRVREQAAREQERQRAEALAELDRTKTRFFSNVSHEFRTPLTLMLAPLQDALSDSANPLPPAQQERLELLHRNSLRLLKLVNTLLDFSRIEAGRIEAVYEPTDLAQLTTELSSVFRSAIERAGLELVVDCPPLPEPVFVDREMWEKIVLNLLSNAFKFTFKGEISVSLHSIDSHQVILKIKDTGTGIAPKDLPYLFERFYQVRGTQTRTHEGSGIGLALVHELVRLHGGTIEVSSTVGKGTCFAIALRFGTEHLPSDRLRRGEAERVASPQKNGFHLDGDSSSVRTLASTAMGAAAYGSEAERWLSEDNGKDPSIPIPLSAYVLVIDDNADMREYLTRILSDHVQVEAVADGAMALAVAQKRLPDLILSDVMMPGLDGFELLQALRSDPRTEQIPIILLSARAGEEAIIEGLDAGADDYLIKPFSAKELISRVQAHLQMAHLRRQALDQAHTSIRQRDELLSTVSHELNTPLVSILGWTRLLRANPPSPFMLSKALDTIERNATLQAQLVQDLLDISRITVGKLRLSLQPIELQSVIEMAMAAVSTAAIAKNIDLDWQSKASGKLISSIRVLGDRDRLQQVFCNLLTNAVKFTPESGMINVELSILKAEPTVMAEVRITDTGIGIAADFLPFVFERFRQAENTSSAKGLGLGLAIAQHLVELHNGTISADSAGSGQGATFIVRLPVLTE